MHFAISFNETMSLNEADRALLGFPCQTQRLVTKAGIRMMADRNPEELDHLNTEGSKYVKQYWNLFGIVYDREGEHFFDIHVNV